MTPQAHKCAAAAGSFCFVTRENGEQQDVYNLTTAPCVQRSLFLDEVINDSSSGQVEVPKRVDNQTRDMLERCMATCGKAAGAKAESRSCARKEASAQRVRGYCKQFAEAKNLEWQSWIDNEVFDLRKVRPKNYVTGQNTHRQDRQARQLPQSEGQLGTARFPRRTERSPANRFTCVHKTRISDELPDGSRQKLEFFPH